MKPNTDETMDNKNVNYQQNVMPWVANFKESFCGVIAALYCGKLISSPCRMGIACEFLTIYDDLYKTYLWGICITLNMFVALTSA